ncbi:MAG: FAD-dependent oxidoreductase [Myxococcaceae bacterium]
MDRRSLLKRAGALALLPFVPARARAAAKQAFRRVRPSELGWPTAAHWDTLGKSVEGQLLELESPFAACGTDPRGAACTELFRTWKNPYAVGDSPTLTQTSGWTDAWVSQPSAYAVVATRAEDVAAAVSFARAHRLRLAVKGGGHSYQGTSCAPDSLLVWTRKMNAITLHDSFVPEGCAKKLAATPAVSVGAGSIWMHTYEAVCARAGRYVQGGGCGTVGVAGLVQSGGFGSFSKQFGSAASSLLEAEVVTADGKIRVVNACRDPELFWGLKGGGGGSLAALTRLTLRTHTLPPTLGVAWMEVKASSDDAFRGLIRRFVDLYAERLFNPTWGETMTLHGGDTLQIQMLFHSLSEEQARDAWKPLLDAVAAAPGQLTMKREPTFLVVPGRKMWDTEFLRTQLSQVILLDDRPGAPSSNVFWKGNLGEAGQFLHGYVSAWMPQSLLAPARRQALVDALFAASQHWSLALHFNKGLAGAPPEAIAAARDTATNPHVLDAFALAIVAGEGPPARPGVSGHEPDLARARRAAKAIHEAMAELRKVAPGTGSYVSESDYFEPDWQRSFWGTNYPRLLAAKRKYDPEGLFFVHHGVGSEDWTDDGFTFQG